MRSLADVFIVHGYYGISFLNIDIWLPYAYRPHNTTTISTNVIKCSFCGHNFDVDYDMSLF